MYEIKKVMGFFAQKRTKNTTENVKNTFHYIVFMDLLNPIVGNFP